MFHTSDPMRRRLLRALPVALARPGVQASVVWPIGLLAACGSPDEGSVGTGGTGSWSFGPITDFGSIVVGGIHFEESAADLRDQNGVLRLIPDLSVGSTVVVDAGAVRTTGGERRAVARTIRIVMDLVGPVDGVVPASRTIIVMGQVVQVTPSTQWASGLTPERLSPGQVVAVSVLAGAAPGRLVATRVAPQHAGATVWQLRGVVEERRGTQVRVGAQWFELDGATLEGAMAAGGGPGPEAWVRLRITPAEERAALAVTRVSAGRHALPDTPLGVLDGVVSADPRSGWMEVDGQAVDTSGAVTGAPLAAQLVPARGRRVVVEGPVVGGVLHASGLRPGPLGEGDPGWNAAAFRNADSDPGTMPGAPPLPALRPGAD